MSGATPIPWHRPMAGRDPDEEHRASTPLELFFDLCFVVAVAAAAATLHHDLSHGHLSGIAGYAMVFFAIWWAWVNYSWFASAYDTDDVIFRLLTFVVMTGVLVLAAGTPQAAGEDHNFGLIVVGYLIMRVAMVPLWLRVSREHPEARGTALRYVAAIIVIQALWVLRLFLFGDWTGSWVSFLVLVVLEMATPFWAEHRWTTPWHRHHIAERYELFTIIVLGEVILATTQAIAGTLDGHGLQTQLLLLIVGALFLVFSMWWVYFKRPMVDSLRQETSFVFGYVHSFAFASAAAVGACLAVLVDIVEHDAHIGSRTGVLLLAAAVSVYLLVIAGLHSLGDRSLAPAMPVVVLVAGIWVIGLLGLGPGTSVLLIGLAVALSLADHVRRSNRLARPQG
ncbi:MAG: low temperature requirement protein A [Marmoricola sp.]